MTRRPLVELDDLKVWFPIKSGVVLDRHVGDVKAVDGVSFTIERGETLGLVGESGCGKSTVGRAIIRLYKPTAGRIVFDGRRHHTRRRDASCARSAGGCRWSSRIRSPRSTRGTRSAGSSASRCASTASREAAGRRRAACASCWSASGSRPTPRRGTRTSSPAGSGSGSASRGRWRVNPAFIVCDEPVSALDVSIQAQIMNLLEDLQDEFGLTYLFIAHDLAVVRHISDRIAVMYLGGIVEVSPAEELYEQPAAPVHDLAALGGADPGSGGREAAVADLPDGRPPSPANPPRRCRFHTRCPYVQPTRCTEERPELRTLSSGHTVACHWAAEIKDGVDLAGRLRTEGSKRTPVVGLRASRTPVRQCDAAKNGAGIPRSRRRADLKTRSRKADTDLRGRR